MRERDNPEPNENLPVTKEPDDVAALYSRADEHGARSADFPTFRRQSRPQVRHQANLREGESASRAATPAWPASRFQNTDSRDKRSLRETDKIPRFDAVERREGVRRVEAAHAAEVATRRSEREMIDLGQSARGQVARRARSETPARLLPTDQRLVDGYPAKGYPTDDLPGVRKVYRTFKSDLTDGLAMEEDFDYRNISAEPSPDTVSEASAARSLELPDSADLAGPAWLYASATPEALTRPLLGTDASQAPEPPPSVADTLQYSRERVASRWFALKDAFEQPDGDPMKVAALRQQETRTPVLAVFSLAGGVGKTSLVATVGRSLSSMGEKVMLADTASHGLLPFYFGATELHQDTVRSFSPPSGSTDAPIFLVSHAMEQKGSEETAQGLFIEEVMTNSQDMHRILMDLNAVSGWVIRQMARMNLTVLVPVTPDMNSVISLGFVEKFFDGLFDNEGRPLRPLYVLNRFDPSLPLHLDVREVLRRKLGDRLLPFVIHHAPSVSEALAEGMTVIDYVPDTPIAEDYINVATWLRGIAAPATASFRNIRWSER